MDTDVSAQTMPCVRIRHYESSAMIVGKHIADAIPFIQKGGVGVMPTDTLYGLIGQALNKEAVERVYELKGRREDKPCIILVPDAESLQRFEILSDERFKQIASRVWPGAVSVVIGCSSDNLAYLHRGTKTLAFRVPNDEGLRTLLREAGPVVAPSANPEGEPPARDISSARTYFGDRVDFYIDGGTKDSEPSTVVRYEGGALQVLRQGVAAIPKL